MNKDKASLIPLISFVFILLASVFGVTQENDFVIGDFVLSKFGLPIWSHGLEGLHYSALISILFGIIGLIGFASFFKEVSLRLKVLILITLIFGHSIFFQSYTIVKGYSNGLETIDFYRNQSYCNFRSTDDNKFIKIDSKIVLTNYSKNRKYFYIRLLLNRDRDQLMQDKSLIAIDDQTNNPKVFSLNPKTKTTINAVFMARQNKGISSASGSFSDMDVIIFDKKGEVKFIKGIY